MKRPNILLICVDHWPGRLMRPAGHPVVMTPTLAQLAGAGRRFTNAYSPTPSCIPARRSLMTGLTARTHRDRVFNQHQPMPQVPTLPQCFRGGGYQAFAVGKLHVSPQRDRIGFDDVILNEEGRHQFGMAADDWELYLAEQGFGGLEYSHGLCNNDYMTRPWPLPEHCHPTNWAAHQMCRVIHRRDPRKPGFWYLSFAGPHPPVCPPQAYMDHYRSLDLNPPVYGDWSENLDKLPWSLKWQANRYAMLGAPQHEIDLARRAFYATLTHIDHQIRVVIGTLCEEGLLDNTIIGFVSDHGDMLGDHHQWAKGIMYEGSAKIPMLLVPAAGDQRIAPNTTDDRLVCLEDVQWVKDGKLVGMPDKPFEPVQDRGLLGQRGIRFM